MPNNSNRSCVLIRRANIRVGDLSRNHAKTRKERMKPIISDASIHTQERVTVIILAASPSSEEGGHAKVKVRGDAAFLNVGTKLAIERICNFFVDKPRVDVILGVACASKSIFNLKPFAGAKIFEVGNTSSACETILRLIDHVNGEWCLINPITAVPATHLSSEGAIYFGQDQIPKENWASMTLHSVSKPIFHAKQATDSFGLPSFPFTGRIYAKKDAIRRAVMGLAIEQQTDLIYLAKSLFESGHAKIYYERWLDAGHEATYADSKLLAISSRFFNSVIYDKTRNSILKRSEQKTKIELEGRFFSECPSSTRRYFPLVLNSSNKGSYWELELEYIGYPSLAEVFLFGNIGLNSWRRIIESLGRAFDEFYNCQSIKTDNAAWLYSSKTRKRQHALEEIFRNTGDHCLKEPYKHRFRANGIELPSIEEGFDILAIELNQIEQARALHIGHGDLCFNNILVDPVYGSLKFIDPKAELDAETNKCGLMDSLYDLAKLSHSFQGLYDSVVNNLYALNQKKTLDYGIEIYTPPCYDYISGLFLNSFLTKRVDERVCTLVTSNLFLSMLPLHSEDPQRMLALAIIGLTLLTRNHIREFHQKP